MITEILTTSPAYKTGVRLGDVMIQVNGEKVRYPEEVDFINWGLFIGDTMEMLVDRQGQEKRFRFEVVELDAS